MTVILFIVVVILLLLNYMQNKEIIKMKSLIEYDDKEIEEFAKETLRREANELKTIKLLREKYYPMDLLTAKKIVDKIKEPRQD